MTAVALAVALAGSALAAHRPISVLSFNVAGVPVVHPKIAARMKAIGALLAKGGYDVIVLQEVWRDSDAETLHRASGLPYRARSPQAWPFGDGLLILSRWRVLETRSLAYRERTEHWLRLDGEQLAHKGALLARVDVPGGELDVIDTHLVADYQTYHNDAVRGQQVRQLLPWASGLTRGRPFVLAGDLNMAPDNPLVAEVRGDLDVTDACGADCGASTDEGRIDYVLVSSQSARGARASVTLDEAVLVGGTRYQVSDHRAILAVLQ